MHRTHCLLMSTFPHCPGLNNLLSKSFFTFSAVWCPVITLCDFDYSTYFSKLWVFLFFFSPLSCECVCVCVYMSWFLSFAYGQCVTVQLSVSCYYLWPMYGFEQNKMNEWTATVMTAEIQEKLSTKYALKKQYDSNSSKNSSKNWTGSIMATLTNGIMRVVHTSECLFEVRFCSSLNWLHSRHVQSSILAANHRHKTWRLQLTTQYTHSRIIEH